MGHSELWCSFRQFNVGLLGIPEREKKEFGEDEAIFGDT